MNIIEDEKRKEISRIRKRNTDWYSNTVRFNPTCIRIKRKGKKRPRKFNKGQRLLLAESANNKRESEEKIQRENEKPTAEMGVSTKTKGL